ncbi:MAG: gliding motility lipoprotein GldD [Flavobacteriales bacterium]|nr:gliding motility lipoprotein GldD [Flavobacteriales bacterium]
MTKKILLILVSALVIIATGAYFFLSHGSDIPRPRGYFRIDLPEKSYRVYETACPLQMEVPNYAKVELFKDKMSSDSCWFNVYFPKFNARIHCSYMPVNNNMDRLLHDAYGFAAKHEMKATALKRTIISDSLNQVYGIVYDIEGEAASQLQFFLTDSTSHFFRGSLYFFNAPNPDSIAPVLDFLREDVMHLTETIRWK